jgi:hypothetical protein
LKYLPPGKIGIRRSLRLNPRGLLCGLIGGVVIGIRDLDDRFSIVWTDGAAAHEQSKQKDRESAAD